jgi:DNA topoisomerase-1
MQNRRRVKAGLVRKNTLFDMIWKRTIATQMADARLTLISVDIAVDDAMFGANGKRIDFPGFFRAYVEGSDDPDSALEDREVRLPPLKKDDGLKAKKLDPVGHETQPPARYTEASLVQTLEREVWADKYLRNDHQHDSGSRLRDQDE